ncbi:MAG: SDR family NAD(P)-dependent oxidoreductase [Anaerolineae bacterium]|nr:SDR family NAD(P)-dependent oxidoreductase [Anaerolineae bacterium]MCO5199061.1 SDR family NAD(P)-dependent oxidoreductase [Anaerolineae bacterium]
MKTALVWGATGGIGRAVTELLLTTGWQVVAFSRQPQHLDGIATFSFEANFANPASVDHALYNAALMIDEADLFIYTAGDIAQAKVENMDSAEWQRIIDANLTGPYLTTHASLPLLTPDAHLFFIGAISERLQLPSLSSYAAAKAGLEAFAATLAKEQRKRKVTVVRPGAVDTPFWDKVTLRKPADAAPPDRIAQRIMTAYNQGTTGHLDITH